VAVVTARMKGWETCTFLERHVIHHRRMGAANHSLLGSAFKGGFHDYLMGVHSLWQVCRCCYKATRRPLVLSGALLLANY